MNNLRYAHATRISPPLKAVMRAVPILLVLSAPLHAIAQAPANDNPCGAINLTVGVTCSNTAGTTQNSTTTTGVPAPGCANYNGRDVWYKLTVPINGAVSVRTTANTITDGGMAAYSATACGGTFTLLACDDDLGTGSMPQLDMACLTSGSTLYIRFWKNGGGQGTFSICAVAIATMPANDDPCGATTLTAAASCTYSARTTVNATNSVCVTPPSCGSFLGNDVWFKVTTASFGTLSVATTANSLTDGALSVYSATACGGTFTELVCVDDVGANAMPSASVSCLAAGTYYVRFWGVNGTTGTFNICTTFAAGSVPANDDPCGAITLPPNTSCSYVPANNNCSTGTTGQTAPGCGTYSGEDVWYKVTTTSYGMLTVNTTAGTITDGAMAIYTGSPCSSTLSLQTCANNGTGMPSITLSCLAAGTFYIRFWEAGGGTGTFNICAQFTALSVLTNDDPCGAATLTVNTTCSPTTADNTCATTTTGVTAPGCGGYGGTAHDLWYKFVAPSDGIVVIESTAGTLTDGSMAVYSGTCGSLSLVDCDDDSGPGAMPFLNFTTLTGGQTYFLRYWGSGGASGTFNLCVRSPAVPSGTSCVLFLQMYDSNGNGWGSSTVSVSINGGSPTVYTVTNSYELALIGVNIGNVVVVTYSNSGGNQGQNSYTIKLLSGGSNLFSSGSPPTNGIAWTQTVNCQQPPASQDDCLGAKSICGGQSFNANPQGTGQVSDLSGANYGCLTSSERQGLWYIFKVSAGGNIGMTIDPVANDDYDWAIWGPYPSTSTTTSVCIPSGPPIRCSYASGTATNSATGSYNTGMGNPTFSSPQFAATTPARTQDDTGNGWVSGIQTTSGQVYLFYISNYTRSGLAYDLTWQFGGGASLDCAVLPIELFTLSAEESGNEVQVRWTTLSEHVTDYFSVERSSDGEHFSSLGTLEAAGESQQRIDYLYNDVAPVRGANYYRLRQVDVDGAYEYTYVVVALFGYQEEAPLLFPNPATDRVLVAFELPRDATTTFDVLDASGRIVQNRSMDLEHGPRTVDMDINTLMPGAYELRVSTGQDAPIRCARFVKQ